MYAISADYPGDAMKAVERELGGSCLFTLGCAGNIVPIEREGMSKNKIGMSLAAEVIKTWQWLDLTDSMEVLARSKRIELPLKKTGDERWSREVEIQVLKVGNSAFVGLPGEIFVEIGTAIKKQSDLDHLFPVSLANGSYGYIPIEIAYDQGGYESNSSSFAKGSGEILTSAALELVSLV
jgi:hypothetical protein